MHSLPMLFQAGAPGTALPVQLGRGCQLDPSYKSQFRALLSGEAEFCLENTGKLLKREFSWVSLSEGFQLLFVQKKK